MAYTLIANCKRLCVGLFALLLVAQDATPKPPPQRVGEHALAEFSVGGGAEPLIVPVRVQWRPTGAHTPPKQVCMMLLDTGATMTAFDASHRALLGEPVGKAAGESSNRVAVEFESFLAPSFGIGPIDVQPRGDVVCFDMRRLMYVLGERIDGILGMDVLVGLVLSIDFDRGKVRLLSKVDGEAATRIPIMFDGMGCPQIAVELPDAETEHFLVDTGKIGGNAGNLRSETYERLLDTRHLRSVSPRTFAPVVGVDGVSYGELRRVSRLSVAGYVHEGLVFRESGTNILGIGYLSRYNVTFDFPHRAMYLRPGKRFARQDLFDLSGLWLSRNANGMHVVAATEDRPARAAGIGPGDIITELDGESTRSVTLSAARHLLSLPGRHVLLVRRGASEFQVILKLGERPQGSQLKSAEKGTVQDPRGERENL